jgi:hypothetical protein
VISLLSLGVSQFNDHEPGCSTNLANDSGNFGKNCAIFREDSAENNEETTPNSGAPTRHRSTPKADLQLYNAENQLASANDDQEISAARQAAATPMAAQQRDRQRPIQ